MIEPKGEVARSIREKEQGDHAKIKFKGEHIKVFHGRECDMVGCPHAFEPHNACSTALCLPCFEQLKLENEPESKRKRDRKYKFPGCRNHSFWDMREYVDQNGAHWCTDHQKKHPNDTRPLGCVHCLRPFLFCGSKGKRKA